MDDLEKIEKKLRAAASDNGEEERLVELFETACAGLASQTSSGVKDEVEKTLGELMVAISEKAGAIEALLRE